MSKILLYANDDFVTLEFIIAIHKITDNSIINLKKHILNKKPFFECELYKNDHCEIEKKLILILKEASKFKIAIEIYEIPDSIEIEDANSLSSNFLISEETLKNILKSWKEM